jgi:hypothetical protein
VPKFYFNVIAQSDIITDLEGSDLATLDTAKLEAVYDARALMSEAVLRGRDISDWRIEISDDAGAVFATLGFSDAIRRFD